MADSTTNLDLIAASQSGKETTANEMFDAMSPAALFGRRATTTSGLTWGYYGGGYVHEDGTVEVLANGTIALTASATNYLYDVDGVVTKATAAPTGWPGPLASGSPLYEVVTGGSSVTSYVDYRARNRSAGGATSPLTTKGDVWGYSTTDARVPVGTDGQVFTADSAQTLGVKWASPPFDVTAFYPGTPSASAKVLRVPLARAVSFAANFASSRGAAGSAATGSTDFDVQKNGVSVGTITFAAAGTTATFVTAGGLAVSFAAGDVLSIIAPASPDATLADVGFTLAGTR